MLQDQYRVTRQIAAAIPHICFPKLLGHIRYACEKASSAIIVQSIRANLGKALRS